MVDMMHSGSVPAQAAGGETGANRSTAAAPVRAGRRDEPVPLQGSAFTGLTLRLGDPKDPVFFQRLTDKVLQAPDFFRHAPVVVDLADLADGPPVNIAEIGRRLRQHGLVPIGIQNGTDEHNKDAINAGFAVFAAGRPMSFDAAARGERADTDADAGAPARQPAGSTLIARPIRSGRQVYAHGGDLVITAAVGAGAEILADGHIHVYGALRGRALAGVSGDTRARIFCASLEAELISIAGYWRVRDDIPEALIGRPSAIHLEDERVVIAPLVTPG